MKSPILITGCARSGTSMTAGILDHCGAFGGKTTPATSWNRKGQFENDEIRENIVKPLMRFNGADPLGQNPLPDINHLMKFNGLRKKIESIFQYSGCDHSTQWYYKGAKMCLLWPTWHEAFPKAKWVVVRRKDEDIVYSCLRTAFMKAFKHAEGWQSWVDEHKKRFVEMIDAGLDVHEIWPSKFVGGDFSEIKALVDVLGLEWQEEAVMDFVDPKLWRGKTDGC